MWAARAQKSSKLSRHLITSSLRKWFDAHGGPQRAETPRDAPTVSFLDIMNSDKNETLVKAPILPGLTLAQPSPNSA
jgi:hypothetical protein